jgi:alkanesulfonate monooxygenase SsuD/methylene tetrahydromethanopterin reductase-like flavin-dependent oxidoreductase (luciferase family)
MSTQLPMFTWVEDHRDRVSFGIQPVPRPDDPTPGKSLIEAGRLCEELGFDAFFIGDHPAYAPEPWLHLAAVATETKRIRLGSVVNCIFYRHPVMLARLATDLDHISDGRVILGIGIGWNEEEFAQLGIPFPSVPERQKALDEAVTILNGVWGPEPFTFHGRHFSTTNERIAPPPIQRPRPPLMIAGGGEKVTLRQVAQYAEACNFGSGRNVGRAHTHDEVRHKLAVLKSYCEEIGRPYDSILRTHFTSWLIVAESDEEAQAKLNRYYPDGLTEEQRLTRIAGSPERIAAYFQGLVDAGMQYFVVQVMDANDHETFRLLAQEVAPRVTMSAGRS